MKKILLSLFLITGLTTIGFAQSKVGFGVKAGVTIPHMTVTALGSAVSFDSKISFYVGGVANIPVSKLISVQPGLSLINKGTKISSSGLDFEDISTTDESGSINLMYLEIPVNLLFNLQAGNAGKFFFGAGPYYAIGIDANSKYGGVTEDIVFGSDEDNIRRGEFGFNFLGGYQLNNGLNLHLNYGLAMSSVLPEQEYNVKFKNRVFSVGLGFNF
jgi:hypothetical protein